MDRAFSYSLSKEELCHAIYLTKKYRAEEYREENRVNYFLGIIFVKSTVTVTVECG